MSFVAVAPNPAAQVATPPASIVNDGFWPDVELSTARETMRMADGTVTDSRLTAALVAAIIEVGRDLVDYKADQLEAGHTRLADVPADLVAGVSVQVHNYLRAVCCTAKADLLERYADYDLTAKGQRETETQATAADDERRNASWAITALLGRGRATVELI